MSEGQVTFSVNARAVSPEVAPDTPLLWVLREQLGLTGTKFGCGAAQCGACTVLVNGEPRRSCVTPVSAVTAQSVMTIEGAQSGEDAPVAKALYEAWVAYGVPQCGYCQSGMLMAALALLKSNATPDDAELDQAFSGHICRCGSYQRLRAAVHSAADALRAADGVTNSGAAVGPR